MNNNNIMAAIDIGSNTVQLLIAESEGKRFRPLLFQLRTTRLGASAVPGLLAEERIKNTLVVLREYQGLIAQYDACHTRVIATSAVRDAQNRAQLLDAAKAQTGLDIEVISGPEEARLSFLGATAFLDEETWARAKVLLIDIGGSSSELARWQDGELAAVSADVGAVRACSQGWGSEEILRRLAQVISPQPGDSEATAIGAGGTITTAAGLLLGCPAYDRAAIEGYRLTLAGVERLLATLQPLSIEERCALSPLLAQRGEIIYEGLLIVRAFFCLLQLPYLLVSGGGVPDGCLIDAAALRKS